MHNYLNDKTADYITTTLSIPSSQALPQTGDKRQVVHEFDDGSISVVGISTDNYFTIKLQWKFISEANNDIIMDFWFNEAKGAGRRRTFYWEHPIDGQTYTVRFMSPLTSVYTIPDNLSISQITLRVEGNKP